MKYIIKKPGSVLVILIALLLSGCFLSKFEAVKCDYNDPKEQSLCEMNNKLNKYLSKKDWEAVYNLKRDAESNSVGGVIDKEDFIRQCKHAYMGGSINYKMLSMDIDGDKAMTTNKVVSRVFFWPFKAYPDTSLHYWRYSNNAWYLYDWDRRPRWE